jgi:glycosidase
MQLFGRGLRRRLPTMLNGDRARIRMVYSLTFALPGAAVLFYGEEIGMAENLAIPGRMSVRSPMQWTAGENAGFSTAEPGRLLRPVVGGKKFGPAAVNVAAQRRDRDSMLSWMERLIRCRRECPEVGWGAWQAIGSSEKGVLALRYDWGDRVLLVAHNLAAGRCRTSLKLERGDDWLGLVDLLDSGACDLHPDGTLALELEGYGHRWLRVERAGSTVQL